MSHNFFTEIEYSNASRDAASKCVSCRYMVLNLVQKHLRYTDFDQKPCEYADFPQIFRRFLLILAKYAGIFWVLTNLMLHGFLDTHV